MIDHAALAFWLVLVWLLVATHGAIIAAIRLHDAYLDRRWLHDNDLNGPKSISADAGIRAAQARLVLFIAFILVAVNALVGHTAPGEHLRQLVAFSLFVLTLVTHAIAQQLDARDSVRLMTMLQISRAAKQPDGDPSHAP